MADTKQQSDTAILNRFKKSFLLHSSRYTLYSDETIVKGSVATHNRSVTALGKLQDKVIENPSLYSDLILEFLEGDDLKAALCAGFTCLWSNIHTEKAIEKLTYIAKNTRGISMIASFDISGSITKFRKKQMEAKPRNEIDALAEKMKPAENGGENASDEELLEIINNLPDINKCGYDERTPLIHACVYNRFVLVKRLLELGADVNKKDYTQKTALHCAAVIKNIDTIILLLNYGVEVNAQDNHGSTALEMAKLDWIKVPQEVTDAIVELLIANGAKTRRELLNE